MAAVKFENERPSIQDPVNANFLGTKTEKEVVVGMAEEALSAMALEASAFRCTIVIKIKNQK